MRFWRLYWTTRRGVICLFTVSCLIFAALAVLSGMGADVAAYGLLLCGILGLVTMVVDVCSLRSKHRLLTEIGQQTLLAAESLPETNHLLQQDYQIIVQRLREENAALASQMDQKMQGMIQYYTMWAHQIKTPIAAMRLLLQSPDNLPPMEELNQETFRIEQYVDMVLQYMRVDSDQSDFVLTNCSLDAIVHQAVKKYASLFIRKKIQLTYEDFHVQVLTDEKWLSFVVEQILSNALKYTHSGTIRIVLEADKTLAITDTGIGIAPEDLPRVFENSFTGYNGREDKKATGIGLYLCKKICLKLGHTISICSQMGQGTTVRVGLAEIDRILE